MAAFEQFLPYRGRWELTQVRRYFARPSVPFSVSLLAEHDDGDLRWRQVRLATGSGSEGTATVVSPVSKGVNRGVVLAHGGSGEGRQFLLSEAAELAAEGAAVVLPLTRIRQNDSIDAFAADVRDAVLIERAALHVLVEAGAPAEALSFLGHGAGGALRGTTGTTGWTPTASQERPRRIRLCRRPIISRLPDDPNRFIEVTHGGGRHQPRPVWIARSVGLPEGETLVVFGRPVSNR